MSVRTRSLWLALCVFGLFLTLTWLVAGARGQLAVGPSCASGGPYEIVAPCPHHTTSLVLVGVFASSFIAIAGTLFALSVAAPNLLVLHWTALLGGLGVLFVVWGVGVDDGVSWNGVLTGALFLVMALPGLYLMTPWQRLYNREKGRPKGMPVSRTAWWAIYAALAAVGILAGAATANAWL